MILIKFKVLCIQTIFTQFACPTVIAEVDDIKFKVLHFNFCTYKFSLR